MPTGGLALPDDPRNPGALNGEEVLEIPAVGSVRSWGFWGLTALLKSGDGGTEGAAEATGEAAVVADFVGVVDTVDGDADSGSEASAVFSTRCFLAGVFSSSASSADLFFVW